MADVKKSLSLESMLERSPQNCVAVTASDTVDLPTVAHKLYLGVSGDIAVMPANSTTSVIFKNHPVGYLPLSVRRVLDTGTAAGVKAAGIILALF